MRTMWSCEEIKTIGVILIIELKLAENNILTQKEQITHHNLIFHLRRQVDLVMLIIEPRVHV